jgi:DNA-binding CsgD family transcriptional regulator
VREGGADGWLDRFVPSMRIMSHLLFGSLVVDAVTGRIVAMNPRAVELLGGLEPASVGELVDRGVLTRSAVREMAAHADAEQAESWRMDVTLHLPAGSAERTVVAASVDDPRSDARAIVTMLCERGVEQIFVDIELPDPAPFQFHVLLDEDLRVKGNDPRLGAYWDDPMVEVGALIWLFMHPADIHVAHAMVHRMWAGDLRTVEFTVRVRTPWGNWTPAHMELRRMLTDGPTSILNTMTFVGDFKQTIGPGQLTPRELAVVRALFEGRRVPQIAKRDGVSEKTLRNQLTAIFRKLDVSDQGELLDSYHPPPVETEISFRNN